MTDLVAMKAKTTFHNARVQNDKGGLVETGDTFETDVMHAKDLQRLGHAVPVGGSLDEREDAPLEPHHQVSERALVADRAKRAASKPAGAGGGAARRERTDGPTVEEYVTSGYRAENYPPEGYASRSTPEEITTAIAAQADN